MQQVLNGPQLIALIEDSEQTSAETLITLLALMTWLQPYQGSGNVTLPDGTVISNTVYFTYSGMQIPLGVDPTTYANMYTTTMNSLASFLSPNTIVGNITWYQLSNLQNILNANLATLGNCSTYLGNAQALAILSLIYSIGSTQVQNEVNTNLPGAMTCIEDNSDLITTFIGSNVISSVTVDVPATPAVVPVTTIPGAQAMPYLQPLGPSVSVPTMPGTTVGTLIAPQGMSSNTLIILGIAGLALYLLMGKEKKSPSAPIGGGEGI